jgi:large conductance mechanosensitive channel
MLKEFRAFIMRGNVLDLAVAVIIGAAFGKIVTSAVNDVLMPPIGFLIGNVDFSHLYIDLSASSFASLAEAQKAGAPVIKYGLFINELTNFLIIAFVIFAIVRFANSLQKPVATPAPATKECPYCLSTIPIKAVRCGQCTSDLRTAQGER